MIEGRARTWKMSFRRHHTNDVWTAVSLAEEGGEPSAGQRTSARKSTSACVKVGRYVHTESELRLLLVDGMGDDSGDSR